MTQALSPFIAGLEPWQYEVSGGFTLRGHYTRPSGKPVVHFIHGNGFTGLVYEKFLAPLTEFFDLFLSNAQGHGDSDLGSPFTNWDDSAGYFREVWQHYSSLWNDVPRIGLGHSFGGVNTLLMAAEDSLLFDRIILLDPIIGTRPWAWVANGLHMVGLSKYLPLAKQALARGTRWDDAESMWEYFYQRGTFKGWEDDCLRSYLQHGMREDGSGGFMLKSSPEVESAIFASYSSEVWSALRRLQISTDIFYGEQTYSFVRSSIPDLASRFEHVRSHEIAGGHCFMQQTPEYAADQVLQILR